MRFCHEHGVTISGNSAGYHVELNETAELLVQNIQYGLSCWESVDVDTMRGCEMAAHLLYDGQTSLQQLCESLYVSMPLLYRAKKTDGKAAGAVSSQVCQQAQGRHMD